MGLNTFLFRFGATLVLSLATATSYGEKGYIVAVDDRKLGDASFILDLATEQHVSKVVFKQLDKRSRTKLEFGPFEPGHHVLLAYFPKGKYQLQSVSVPHYDLPYRYDYDNFENKTFHLRKKGTAYFGQVIVGESRGKNSLDIRVNNRLAMMSPVFEKNWSEHLNEHPLFFAGQYRDHFAETFVSK